MIVARVVGNVWATKKHSGLHSCKLLLVQPIETASGKVAGDIALALDQEFSAGPGDTVLLVDEGNAARAILKNKTAPVRLVVCGIVDSVTVKKNTVKYH